ncbi:helix-turn-helix domain-containing protein [Acetobacter sp.]|jgi:transcriptional regulator with XRE-family HTH domain|uniref:helix-turn-helix domain-containing protein n=1 Tax=Acetobacter sp. TaxID=440 RepID=UPI0025BBB0C7|nr:helix-turn-helix domain-containing protein [Acetobacter sp.]MCH4091122.1 helix-turn-helix domain-containing protein [Acetobacter sp.]MCI1300305.1 helix-turn-helix domain-containing protein [Acetobacter sp.]
MRTAIHLEAGQVWGAGRMKMRRRTIVLIAGHTVLFQIEGEENSSEPSSSGLHAFHEWIRGNGAVLLGTEAAPHSGKVSDRIVGQRLRAARVNARLSQDEVAAQAGISRTAIALWEGGRRGCSLKRLGDVADVLDIALWDLFREEDEPASLPASDETEQRLLALFRRVDISSRSEVLRWLEVRVGATVERSQISDPIMERLRQITGPAKPV